MVFSLGTGGTATSVDSDKPRDPPPPPTVVYFPQNELPEPHGEADWDPKNLPNFFHDYMNIRKPADLQLSDIEKLNISVHYDTDLEDLIPDGREEYHHLPPPDWTQNLDPTGKKPLPGNSRDYERPFLLSNRHRAPTRHDFTKFARELACDTEDGLRAIGRRKVRKGHIAPHLSVERDFWTRLEPVSQYWDTSMDDYYEDDGSAPSSPTSSKSFRRMSLFMTEKHPTNHQRNNSAPEHTKRYKGLRKSTGAKMPEVYRAELVKVFIRNVVVAFQCVTEPTEKTQLEIFKLQFPVSQTAFVYRRPESKDLRQRAIMEGPLLSIQCRGATSFFDDKALAAIDMTRETACLLALAQQRQREGKPKRYPGADQWWVKKARWGGGPGGEFGESEGNSDLPPPKRLTHQPGQLPRRMTEEEIWKELKPTSSPWINNIHYAKVGGNGEGEVDTVFMISSLFHHICFLRLDVDPAYITYLLEGPRFCPEKLNDNWEKPHIYRSKWYDLLDKNDRLEAFRGVWGIMAYLMRVDSPAGSKTGSMGDRPKSQPRTERQASETPHGLFSPMRRKSVKEVIQPIRSHSIA